MMEGRDSYPIRCILPHDRYVTTSSWKVTSSEDQESLLQELNYHLNVREVRFYDDPRRTNFDTSCNTISYSTLGEKFGFEYVPHLIFLHEKDLRELFLNKPDPSENEYFNSPEVDQLNDMVNNGYISPLISIKYIGEIDDVDVGYGVFAEEELPAGTFIGEYVGVVHGTCGTSQFVTSMQQEVDCRFSDRLSYTCQYPSCDGGLGINAMEYGNVIRFLNHSAVPNAELKYYWGGAGSVMHVLCVSCV